jgi:hypothetical protein
MGYAKNVIKNIHEKEITTARPHIIQFGNKPRKILSKIRLLSK